jgi:hypothetical protein
MVILNIAQHQGSQHSTLCTEQANDMRNYIPARTVDLLLQLVAPAVDPSKQTLSSQAYMRASDLRHVLRVCQQQGRTLVDQQSLHFR